jgi:hypothetical protein
MLCWPRRIIPNFIKNESTPSNSCRGGGTDRITMSGAASSLGTRNKLAKMVHGRHISRFDLNTFLRRHEFVRVVGHHSTTTRHAFVTRVTAASQGCGRKRTRPNARRKALRVKIMWAQLNTSDNLVVFSVFSLSIFTAVQTGRSAPTVGSCAAAERAVALVWRVAPGWRVTWSAHPSFCTWVRRLFHRSKAAGAWRWAPIAI